MQKRLLINVDLKEPKTFEEQVMLIQEKGFLISEKEEPKCIEFLKKANYYRLSAYFLPFRKNDGEFPIWVIIEFFSIGMLSYFYSDMKAQDKKIIATTIYRTGAMQLESWLRCLTDLRNRCAHYSRIYYWSFTAIPKMPKNYNYQTDRRLFTQILMLGFLYPDKETWKLKFVSTLAALIEEYRGDISLKHIGFPEDWENRII